MIRPNIPAMTSMRFFAALLVVLFHYALTHPQFRTSVTNFGYEAVTFFFVLSGFILVYVHADGSHLNVSARTFFRSRAARIAPAYFLALLIAAPFYWRTASQDAWTFIGGLISVPTMIQAWLPPLSTAWNGPAWSLSNEAFFYLCFPALWPIMYRARLQTLVIATIGAVTAADLLRLFVPSESSPQWHNFSAYFPLLNMPQFIAGMTLGRVFLERRPSATLSKTLLLIGVAGAIAAIASKPTLPVLATAIILVPVFSCLIIGAALTPLPQLTAKPITLLGDASYAIYILHLPIWLWWQHLTDLSGWTDFLAYLALVIGSAVMVYLSIERPARRIGTMTARPSPRACRG